MSSGEGPRAQRGDARASREQGPRAVCGDATVASRARPPEGTKAGPSDCAVCTTHIDRGTPVATVAHAFGRRGRGVPDLKSLKEAAV